jgi:hypothetical protein
VYPLQLPQLVPRDEGTFLLGVFRRLRRFCELFVFHYNLRPAEISIRTLSFGLHCLAQVTWASAFRWASTMLELYAPRLGHLHGGSGGPGPRTALGFL